MRLGIDFGTSRTVVSVADRGNYPIVQFRAGKEDWFPWYPSVIGCREGLLRYGFEAEELVSAPSSFLLPSFKRLLRSTSPHQEVDLGGQVRVSMLELLTGFCLSLKTALQQKSNLAVPEDGLEAIIAVPAHANSNQRYLTLEAFRRAGFTVPEMVNEPSAAGIEYTHQYLRQKGKRGQREYLAVYDWGAGTFDSAIIRISDLSHEVMATQGVSRLGGDDLDEIMLSMALEKSGLPRPESTGDLALLLEECREAKERLRPQSKKLFLDFSAVYPESESIALTVPDFYRATEPLVRRTVEVLEGVLRQACDTPPPQEEKRAPNPAAIYLVGGSSNLPQIEWCLRDVYGRRTQKSPYPHASTAIGLAILADPQSGMELQEKVTRHFGVWRERQGGGQKNFDLIFPKDLLNPEQGTLLRETRTYRPYHNIGHFRFLECTSLDGDGQPQGNITLWEEIFFPFDADLRERRSFSAEEIHRSDRYQSSLIEEVYVCDAHGIMQVELINHTEGYRRIFSLKPVSF